MSKKILTPKFLPLVPYYWILENNRRLWVKRHRRTAQILRKSVDEIKIYDEKFLKFVGLKFIR